jgi:hypothetical protein
MTNNQYHGIAVRRSTTSDLWFTFCPACSEEGARPCYQLDDEVPPFLIAYALDRAWGPVRESPYTNSAAVSKKATATQKAAAAKVYPKSGTIKRRILSLITEKNGLTDEELELALGMKHQTVSASRNALMNSGWIIDSGHTRKNLNGNHATVWIPNPSEGA